MSFGLEALSAIKDQIGTSLVESEALDDHLSEQGLVDEARERIWEAAFELLKGGPTMGGGRKSTVLALGRIQSGKTTAITAITALARDMGYGLVLAVLGSTNLLVEQNTKRLLDALSIGSGLRSTYGWIHMDSRQISDTSERRFADAVSSQRTVLVTSLKHPRHFDKLTQLIRRGGFTDLPTLIIDDEADQASLNTEIIEGGNSPTHRALEALYRELDEVLYTQFTATPYAPLLIEPVDVLAPERVVMLEPGSGYTGAKEFFVDNADAIVRKVPRHESTAAAPTYLHEKLKEALANFMVGSAWLLCDGDENAPISMLVHSSHKTDTHKTLDVLIRRQLEAWGDVVDAAEEIAGLPASWRSQIHDLARTTGKAPPDDLLQQAKRVQRLKHIWVVNSKADEDKVDWSISPAHILIGGNKLDRGFTVEGLTVTYLSRPRSAQLDTLYQRARAFGYRTEYLPYCRFYASKSSIDSFRGGIETDRAMRNSLAAWMEEGKDVRLWSSNEPLLLEKGIRPTRTQVVAGVDVRDLAGWHFASRPSIQREDVEHNRGLVEATGILEAPEREFGALSHPYLELHPEEVAEVVRHWRCDGSCGFDNEAVAEFLLRVAEGGQLTQVPTLLMESPTGGPRERSWSPVLGVTALLQGRYKDFSDGARDSYAGDRCILQDQTQLQIHKLHLKGSGVDELFTIAVHIGSESPLTTELRRLEGLAQ